MLPCVDVSKRFFCRILTHRVKRVTSIRTSRPRRSGVRLADGFAGAPGNCAFARWHRREHPRRC